MMINGRNQIKLSNSHIFTSLFLVKSRREQIWTFGFTRQSNHKRISNPSLDKSATMVASRHSCNHSTACPSLHFPKDLILDADLVITASMVLQYFFPLWKPGPSGSVTGTSLEAAPEGSADTFTFFLLEVVSASSLDDPWSWGGSTIGMPPIMGIMWGIIICDRLPMLRNGIDDNDNGNSLDVQMLWQWGQINLII